MHDHLSLAYLLNEPSVQQVHVPRGSERREILQQETKNKFLSDIDYCSMQHHQYPEAVRGIGWHNAFRSCKAWEEHEHTSVRPNSPKERELQSTTRGENGREGVRDFRSNRHYSPEIQVSDTTCECRNAGEDGRRTPIR